MDRFIEPIWTWEDVLYFAFVCSVDVMEEIGLKCQLVQCAGNNFNVYFLPCKLYLPLGETDCFAFVVTGPAQVPMMSPNGSVPPIYVPPGYVSQV